MRSFSHVTCVTSNTRKPQLRLFRMFRVARVLRVFGKLQQLRHIVNSILRAIVPMIDALLITMMVVFMYATIGVDR